MTGNHMFTYKVTFDVELAANDERDATTSIKEGLETAATFISSDDSFCSITDIVAERMARHRMTPEDKRERAEHASGVDKKA